MALCAVGHLKTESLKRFEVNPYTVPVENNFLFIFVNQFEHAEASIELHANDPDASAGAPEGC